MDAVDPPSFRIEHELITLAGLLFEAEAALEQRLDAGLRASVGMPLATFEVLIRLSRSPRGRLGLSELGRQLAITTGGTTRMIDRLQDDGLVQRARDTADRRTVFAEITERGRQALTAAVDPHIADLEATLAARLSADEIASLQHGLRALRDSLHRQ